MLFNVALSLPLCGSFFEMFFLQNSLFCTILLSVLLSGICSYVGTIETFYFFMFPEVEVLDQTLIKVINFYVATLKY